MLTFYKCFMTHFKDLYVCYHIWLNGIRAMLFCVVDCIYCIYNSYWCFICLYFSFPTQYVRFLVLSVLQKQLHTVWFLKLHDILKHKYFYVTRKHCIIWATAVHCISLSHAVQYLCTWQKQWRQNEQNHGTLCRRGVKEWEREREREKRNISTPLLLSTM